MNVTLDFILALLVGGFIGWAVVRFLFWVFADRKKR